MSYGKHVKSFTYSSVWSTDVGNEEIGRKIGYLTKGKKKERKKEDAFVKRRHLGVTG